MKEYAGPKLWLLKTFVMVHVTKCLETLLPEPASNAGHNCSSCCNNPSIQGLKKERVKTWNDLLPFAKRMIHYSCGSSTRRPLIFWRVRLEQSLDRVPILLVWWNSLNFFCSSSRSMNLILELSWGFHSILLKKGLCQSLIFSKCIQLWSNSLILMQKKVFNHDNHSHDQ